MTKTIRQSLWAKVRDRAVQDRESYLDAWANTGNATVIAEIEADIARIRALKDHTLSQALSKDPEGVRVAFHAAQCWYESLEASQIGNEKALAAAMAKRVVAKRLSLFGRTPMEKAFGNSVSVPINKVAKMIESGLSPSEFLKTLQEK